MVLYIESLQGSREHYVISGPEDFDPVIEKYPMVEEVVASCYGGLRKIADEVSNYLSSHGMDSWVEDKDLAKSFRTAAAGLGLAAATLMPTLTASPHQSMEVPKMEHHIPAQEAFGKKPEDRFLWSIMQVESSGGKDTRHKMTGRIHKPEERAIGKWGLLKPTIDEMVVRNQAHGTPIEHGQELQHMSRDDAEHFLKENPHVELQLARSLAHHVIHRHHGDLKRAAYSWLYGHNLHRNEISDQALNDSDYVQKFRHHFKTNNPFKPATPQLATIKKSESPELYSQRLKDWMKMRMAALRVKMLQSNDLPDKGRLRDPKLDQIKAQDPNEPIDYMKQKIKDAKEDRKSS